VSLLEQKLVLGSLSMILLVRKLVLVGVFVGAVISVFVGVFLGVEVGVLVDVFVTNGDTLFPTT
jgi:hypothetical protein